MVQRTLLAFSSLRGADITSSTNSRARRQCRLTATPGNHIGSQVGMWRTGTKSTNALSEYEGESMELWTDTLERRRSKYHLWPLLLRS